MLHAKGIEMPGYTIEAPEPADFSWIWHV